MPFEFLSLGIKSFYWKHLKLFANTTIDHTWSALWNGLFKQRLNSSVNKIKYTKYYFIGNDESVFTTNEN